MDFGIHYDYEYESDANRECGVSLIRIVLSIENSVRWMEERRSGENWIRVRHHKTSHSNRALVIRSKQSSNFNSRFKNAEIINIQLQSFHVLRQILVKNLKWLSFSRYNFV